MPTIRREDVVTPRAMRRVFGFIVTALTVLVAARWVFLLPENGWWWVFKLVLIGLIGATTYTVLADGPAALWRLLQPGRRPKPRR